MRNLRLFNWVTLALGGSLIATAGCKWTEFDTLEDSTWAASQTGPSSVDSDDYATTVIRGRLVADGDDPGSTTIVLSDARITYSELFYDTTGKAKTPGNVIKLDNTFVLPSLDGAITFANPTSNDVTIVVADGNGGVAVLTGTDTLAQAPSTIPTPTPNGADYFVPPAATGATAAADPVILVAGIESMASKIYGVGQGSCVLVDNGVGPAAAAITFSAIAPMSDTTGPGGLPQDDILVLTQPATGNAQLLVYPASVSVGCGTANVPVPPVLGGAGVDSGLDVVGGAEMKVFEDSSAAGHEYAVVASNGDKGGIALFDLGLTSAPLASRTPVMVGMALGATGLATIEVASIGGVDYVLAGYPDAIVDGVDAGQVQVSEIDTTATGSTSAIAQPPAMVLNDAQPDSEQTFGRSIAAVPFGTATDPIIVIAAHNEIFTYFRTALYPDVRSN